MPISLLVILVPLLAAPLATNRIFLATYAWEKAQIASDNAGITVGESDAEVLNAIVAANGAARALEEAHHPLHLCARVPKTRPLCEPPDRAIEARLSELHATSRALAKVAWRRTSLEATARAARLGVALMRFDRHAEPPLDGKACPVCGLEPYWEIVADALPLRAVIVPRADVPLETRVRLRGRSLLDGERWGYQFEMSGSP